MASSTSVVGIGPDQVWTTRVAPSLVGIEIRRRPQLKLVVVDGGDVVRSSELRSSLVLFASVALAVAAGLSSCFSCVAFQTRTGWVLLDVDTTRASLAHPCYVTHAYKLCRRTWEIA